MIPFYAVDSLRVTALLCGVPQHIDRRSKRSLIDAHVFRSRCLSAEQQNGFVMPGAKRDEKLMKNNENRTTENKRHSEEQTSRKRLLKTAG
jgi:hypothetical protein